MVKFKKNTLTAIFSALADPTRREILNLLEKQDLSVSELAKPFEISMQAVLKHLRVLENAGLIKSQKNGRVHHCHLRAEAMKEAAAWMSRYRRFWEDQFDVLEKLLREDTDAENRFSTPRKSKKERK